MADQPVTSYLFIVLDASDEGAALAEALRIFTGEIIHLKDKKAIFSCMNQNQGQNKTIILITSGSLGNQLRRPLEAGEFPTISAIYVYCQNKPSHEAWAKDIPKYKAVCVTRDELLDCLRKNHPLQETPAPPAASNPVTSTTRSTNTATVSTTTVTNAQQKRLGNMFSLNFSLNQAYHLIWILINHFSCIPPRDDEKECLASIFKQMDSNDSTLHGISSEFLQSYHSDRPMNWIQRHDFFSFALSDTLRMNNPQMFMTVGFLWRDLLKQCTQAKPSGHQQWFCGQVWSKEHVEQVKENSGKYATLVSFARATSDRKMAMGMADTCSRSNEKIGVLFIIQVDSHSDGALPHGTLNKLLPNHSEDPNEVVFMLGSLFKIDRVDSINNKLVEVHVTLCAHEDEGLNRGLFEQYKQFYVVNNTCNYLLFSCLLVQLGLETGNSDYISSGRALINAYSGGLQSETFEKYDALALTNKCDQRWDETIAAYKKSIDLRQKCNVPVDRSLVQTCYCAATAFQEKGQHAELKESVRRGLSGLRKIMADNDIYDVDDFQMFPFHCLMASVAEKDNKLNEAKSYYYQALAIASRYEGFYNKDLSLIYNSLANIMSSQKQNELAIGYYHNSLNLKRNTTDENSLQTCDSYINLGKIYLGTKDKAKARDCFEKASKICDEVEPPGGEKHFLIDELLQECSENDE